MLTESFFAFKLVPTDTNNLIIDKKLAGNFA